MSSLRDSKNNILHIGDSAQSNKAKHSRPMPGTQEQGRNRDKSNIITLAEIAKWNAGDNITEILVQCWFNSAVTITTADQLAALSKVYGKVAIDPASPAAAVAAMAVLDSATDDNGYFPVPISLPGAPAIIRIPNTKALKFGDLGGGIIYAESSDGTTALDFWIGAN